MPAQYCTGIAGVTVPTSVGTLFELIIPASRRVTLTEWEVSFQLATSGTPVLIEMYRGTVPATGGNDVATIGIGKMDDGAPDSVCTFRYATTTLTDGTPGTILRKYYVSPTGGVLVQFPLGREFEQTGLTHMKWRFTGVTGAAPPAAFNVSWEE